MKKVKSIFSGIWNYIFKKAEIEKMALKRIFECAKCKHSKKSNTLKKFIGGELLEYSGYKCELCNCAISLKIRSKEEKCAIKKW